MCKNAISNETQADGKDPDWSRVGEEPSRGDTDLLGGIEGQCQDRVSGSVQIAEAKPGGSR